jgi:hypothetical protein
MATYTCPGTDLSQLWRYISVWKLAGNSYEAMTMDGCLEADLSKHLSTTIPVNGQFPDTYA